MLKSIAIIILILSIVGCRSDQQYDIRHSEITYYKTISSERDDGYYGNWKTETTVDEFDGRSTVSSVYGSADNSRLLVWTHKLDDSQVSFCPGSFYICGNRTGAILVRVMFYPDIEEHNFLFSVSRNGVQLDLIKDYENANPQKIRLIRMLNKSNTASFRVIDGCGEESSVMFDISGTTHIGISEVKP